MSALQAYELDKETKKWISKLLKLMFEEKPCSSTFV